MTSRNTTFKPRALGPYIRATDVSTVQVNDLGRVTWVKSYDHEDVETEFRADRVLTLIANTLASLGVFVLLMTTIAVLAQFPESWGSWLVLSVWGV